jgi:TRAP-type C4-dicarboxylate transport system permease small subunit
LGIAYTQQQKGHVRVTILVSKLPQKLGPLLDAFTNLLCLFIVSIVVWQGWEVAFDEKAITDMLRIPDLPFRLLVCLAGISLWLEMFLILWDTHPSWEGVRPMDPVTVGVIGVVLVFGLFYRHAHRLCPHAHRLFGHQLSVHPWRRPCRWWPARFTRFLPIIPIR